MIKNKKLHHWALSEKFERWLPPLKSSSKGRRQGQTVTQGEVEPVRSYSLASESNWRGAAETSDSGACSLPWAAPAPTSLPTLTLKQASKSVCTRAFGLSATRYANAKQEGELNFGDSALFW